MRDYLVFYVNGREHRVSGDPCFTSLATYLRHEQAATGTKIVCEEGDCGACTVLVGRFNGKEISYRAINSCILFLYQLDCTHIVTVEGLKYDGKLNPVQQAMVDCHGAQCGYCTPGFITAMCGMFEKQCTIKEQQVRDELTGNLCRCTGYDSIIQASLAVDASKVLKLGELYPPKTMLDAFTKERSNSALVKTDAHVLSVPADIATAVKFKSEHADTIVVAGGTDICVYWNKRGWEPQHLLSLSNINGLDQLAVADGSLRVGAKTTLSELETWAEKALPELKHILWLFGSPQIRHAGTLAGNVANGSPIADSLPFLCVMEAQIELTGTKGKRTVNINNFYKGYKKMDIAADELITAITIPLPAKTETLRLYKVSKRQHLDISAFAAAFRFTLKDGKFSAISIAYGGVAPTVVRMPKTEEFLLGKPLELSVMSRAADIAGSEVAPISDVRGSRDFRDTLLKNILLKLFYETQQSASGVPA
jgi:xanthine dehydrogenase small subunit